MQAWLAECARCGRPARLTRAWWASGWSLECRACGWRRRSAEVRGELVALASLVVSVLGTLATLAVLRGCA